MTHPMTDPLTDPATGRSRARTPKSNPETRKPGKTASDLHVQPSGLVAGLVITNPETRRITGFPGLAPDLRSTNPAAKPQVRGTLPGFRVSGFGFGLPAHARTRDPAQPRAVDGAAHPARQPAGRGASRRLTVRTLGGSMTALLLVAKGYSVTEPRTAPSICLLAYL